MHENAITDREGHPLGFCSACAFAMAVGEAFPGQPGNNSEAADAWCEKVGRWVYPSRQQDTNLPAQVNERQACCPYGMTRLANKACTNISKAL